VDLHARPAGQAHRAPAREGQRALRQLLCTLHVSRWPSPGAPAPRHATHDRPDLTAREVREVQGRVPRRAATAARFQPTRNSGYSAISLYNLDVPELSFLSFPSTAGLRGNNVGIRLLTFARRAPKVQSCPWLDPAAQANKMGRHECLTRTKATAGCGGGCTSAQRGCSAGAGPRAATGKDRPVPHHAGGSSPRKLSSCAGSSPSRIL
jgi:hypothetical protein